MLLVTVLLLAGCSSSKPAFYWYYPGKTLAEVKADYAECESQAQEEAQEKVDQEYFDHLRSPTVLSGSEKPSTRKSKPGEAELKAKSRWAELYRQNAFAGCMESRGYVKLKPGPAAQRLKTRKLPMGAIAGE